MLGKKNKAASIDDESENVANGSNVDGNGCCGADSEVLEGNDVDKSDVADDVRPPKKTKCSTDETCDAPINGG